MEYMTGDRKQKTEKSSCKVNKRKKTGSRYSRKINKKAEDPRVANYSDLDLAT